MDHIEQLKKIRSEAIARMRNSPDFKLAGKLGLLIVELGETVDDGDAITELEESAKATALPDIEQTPRPFESTFSRPEKEEFADLASDEMIEELVAEIEGDAAELDAIMAEQEDAEKTEPFLNAETLSSTYRNGAAH